MANSVLAGHPPVTASRLALSFAQIEPKSAAPEAYEVLGFFIPRRLDDEKLPDGTSDGSLNARSLRRFSVFMAL